MATADGSCHRDRHNTFHGDSSLHDERLQISHAKKDILGLGLPKLLSEAPNLLKLARTSNKPVLTKDICSQTPLDDPFNRFLTGQMVGTLYNSMLHPPVSYRGDKFQYRSADGGDNNFLFPQLGKAGLPYARTVPSDRAIQGARPDPGDLFDLLMARDDAIESDKQLSSMLLYHATIIIHDIFRSNALDKNISDTSSYLDLSPLYGRDLAHQWTIRTGKMGLLKTDSFAEDRLTNQPPGVCIYLIMYNRFHNYVAKQLLEINENGKFTLTPSRSRPTELPDEEAEGKRRKLSESEREKWANDKLDEDLFQTARLITCGMYINISIHDYLRVLMLVHEKDSPWTLDPRIDISSAGDKQGIGRGNGNQVSVEFNCLYRFHSPISERDARWTEDFLRRNLEGVPGFTPERIKHLDISAEDMRNILRVMYMQGPKIEEKTAMAYLPEGLEMVERGDKTTGKKPVYKYARRSDGSFDDAQLVKEMAETMEDPICHFGAKNVPKFFKSIEILGILQARKWEIATLNEFREFFGMSRHERFSDINTDEKIQQALCHLYEDPDMVELYPGLFCEGDGRNLDPGVSCPNQQGTALWRGVFSDAVTLVRSDRFYTNDWNVGTLTAWGLHEVSSDPKIMKGSVMHRLFLRAFPGHFEFNQVHLWQPFYTPARNLELAYEQKYLKDLEDLKKLGLTDKELSNPVKNMSLQTRREKTKMKTTERKTTITISNYQEIQKILDDSSQFPAPGMLDSRAIPDGALRSMSSSYDSYRKDISTALSHLLDDNAKMRFLGYFVETSDKVRRREDRPMQPKPIQTYQIDIVKDFAIPVVTKFVADILGFGDQIKTQEHPHRPYSENEIYKHICNCQDFLAFNSDETTAWKRRIAFRDSMQFLKTKTDNGMTSIAGGLFQTFTGWLTSAHLPPKDSVAWLGWFGRKVATEIISKLRKTPDEARALLLFIALDAARRTVLMFTEVISYFLETSQELADAKHWKHWEAIQTLAGKDTQEAAIQIRQYILEAQRIRVNVPIVRVYKTPTSSKLSQRAHSVTLSDVPDSKKIALQNGDTLVLQVHRASRNETVFPSASEIKLDRKPETYLIYGSKSGDPFNVEQLSILCLTGMIKHVAKLHELRPAHDTLGVLKTAVMPKPLRDVSMAEDAKESLEYKYYLTPTWDELVPFPTTWNLRHDGVRNGVYKSPRSNFDQGHGMDQIVQATALSASGGTYNSMKSESPSIAAINLNANGSIFR